MPSAMSGQINGPAFSGYPVNGAPQQMPAQMPLQASSTPLPTIGMPPVRDDNSAVVNQPQPMTAVSSQAPPMTMQAMPQQVVAANAQLDDNAQVSADDITWINRARKVIAETQGDPHRQVQLLQHVRAQYLKQRFGRAIHTDEA
jgi:hypothetical protein